MVTRKRRVIEDDDDSDENRQADKQVNQKDKNVAATSMVDRLKRRAAKTAELANKRKKSSPTKSIDTSQTPKKEQSIPKKAKKAQTIPKKLNDDKNGTKNEDDKVKKETPSLLSEMKKPPMPPTANLSMSTSGGGKGNYSISKNKTRPFHSSWGTTHGTSVTPKQMPASPTILSPPNVASTSPPTTVNLVDISGPPDPAATGTKIEEKVDDKFGSGLRQLVLDGLRDLCKGTFEIPPERNGVDLFASFLRHKDLKPTIQTNGYNTESSTNNLRYDFFDMEETTKTIALQPKIPIFPEDFPAGGIREWPLSWWGIVGPSIEEKNDEEKAKSKIDADSQSQSKSRRNRPGARSDSSKDGTGDLSRRDNSRSTRKRSSRDVCEDDNAHDDDDPSRESRRNRFPVGEFDDGEGRYPPQLHGPDYDFDRNGQPPDGYHSNSRNSHHRGGGQPFPHRTRDGPPRTYPRDGPTPRDFRDGGRQYPTHGGSGPPSREYSHRDPYGPQGRGPPSRDDRREHRDRSQRSPNSKMERDDGRHRSSSGKKDRNRSSR